MSISVIRLPLRLLLGILFSMFLINGYLGAQDPEDIVVTIAADGRGETITEKLFLKPDSPYRIQVRVAYPDSAAARLIRAIGEKCRRTYLATAPGTPVGTQLAILSGQADTAQLREELFTIGDLFQKTDPFAKLEASSQRFIYINKAGLLKIGAQTFLEQLSGKLTHGCGRDVDLTFATDTATGTATFTTGNCANNEMVLTVVLPDLEKVFLLDYYNALLDSYSTVAGGNPQEVEAGYAQLADLRAHHLQLEKELDLAAGVLSPCGSLFGRIETAVNAFDSWKSGKSLLLNTASMNWVLATLWLTEGEARLNPLPFTDDDKLSLKSGHDRDKAQQFDQYISSSLRALLNSTAAGDVDVTLLDSLLRLAGTGEKRFSYTDYNKAIKSANGKLRKQHLSSSFTGHRLTLAVMPKKATRTHRVVYDGMDRLRPLDLENFSKTIANQDPAFIIITNVPHRQRVAVKHDTVTIKDESAAAAAINLVGELAASALTQGGSMAPLLDMGLAMFSVGNDKITKVGIRADRQVASMKNMSLSGWSDEDGDGAADKKDEMRSLSPYLHDYYMATLRPILRGRIYDRTISRHQVDISQCHDLSDFPHGEVMTLLANWWGGAPLQTIEDLTTTFENALIEEIDRIINRYTDLSASYLITAPLVKVVNTRSHFLDQGVMMAAALELFAEPASRILPPDKLTPAVDSIPRYRDTLIALPSPEGAQHRTLTLNLMGEKDKRIATTRHGYKTAPGHRFTVSAGLSYTFPDFERIEVTESGGGLTADIDDARFRLVTGLHYHWARLVRINNGFAFSKAVKGKDRLSRFSAYLGVSYPQPLHNVHTGVALDLWPGVKVATGVHWYRHNRYDIVNHSIEERAYSYHGRGFISINVQPPSLNSILGIFQ